MKLVISIALVIFVFAAAAFSQTDVHVTNKVGDAVAVKSVDNPARHGYQVSFDLSGTSLPQVPAGKVFAVEYISGNVRVPSAFGATSPCKFLQLSFSTGAADIEVIPTLTGTAASISNDINFISISQPVRAYISGNNQFGGAGFTLSPSCSGFPTFSHIVFTGYLIND